MYPMEAAPKDGTKVLIYARAWGWNSLNFEEANEWDCEPTEGWRVAHYDPRPEYGLPDGTWRTVTSNPYDDQPHELLGWLPLPEVGKAMMNFHDLDALVRANLPNHRLYDWREVEVMREDLANASMGQSRASAFGVNATKRLDRVQALLDELRAEKKYDVSDRLREALQ